MNRKSPLYLLLLSIFVMSIVSCNSSENEPQTISANVAVTSFALSADTSVVANLDSVFFSIDLDRAVVFNADSLPKGTDVTKLVCKIGYPIVSSAKLYISGGQRMKNDTIINYATNSTDSIDFSGSVKLELVAEDGSTSRKYDIKVNVHNMVPDSLYWNQLARRDLPSYTTPLAQKTVEMNGIVYTLIRESSQYVLATTTNPEFSNLWEKQKVAFSFVPELNTLTATNTALYILDNTGNLYTSSNGTDWTSCNANFANILGAYNDQILTITHQDNAYYHNIYPTPAGYTPVKCESDFPISGTSPMITYTTDWSVSAQSILIGGVTAGGTLTGATWGYDGTNWGKISNVNIPAKKGVVLIPYFTYKVDSQWVATQYTTWLAIGGIDASNQATKEVYVSLNNGITWKKGDDLLQLPSYIAPFANAQAILVSKELEAPLFRSSVANDWEYIQSKELPVWCSVIPTVRTRGYVEKWDCPYIYMFGGESSQGILMNNIWKGVLNRLSFKPII